MILAIDTSTDVASIALCDGNDVLAEFSWSARGRHSQTLTTAIRALLQLTEKPLDQVSAVVVASGPGSFNGLRVGMSLGKGIAMARQAPLVGISTLDALALAAAPGSSRVWSAIGAGRGEVCLAGYAGSIQGWQRATEYMRLPLSDAAGEVPRGQLLVGPAAADIARVAGEMGKRLAVVPPPWNVPRATFLAELGRRYLDAGGGSQLDDVEPLYLRLSAAEEKRAAAMQE